MLHNEGLETKAWGGRSMAIYALPEGDRYDGVVRRKGLRGHDVLKKLSSARIVPRRAASGCELLTAEQDPVLELHVATFQHIVEANRLMQLGLQMRSGVECGPQAVEVGRLPA